MAQSKGYNGTAAVVYGSKVRNISNFGETCREKYFCNGTIWPPMALISGKNSIKNSRLFQKTVEYSQLVTWEILVALSSVQYWIFRCQARSATIFVPKGLKIYLINTDNEKFSKVLRGEYRGITGAAVPAD
jgi:hypothetical protein